MQTTAGIFLLSNRMDGRIGLCRYVKGSNRPNLTVGSYDECALGICLYLSIYQSLCLTHSLSLPSETRRPLVVWKVNEETTLDSLSCRDFVAGAYS